MSTTAIVFLSVAWWVSLFLAFFAGQWRKAMASRRIARAILGMAVTGDVEASARTLYSLAGVEYMSTAESKDRKVEGDR